MPVQACNGTDLPFTYVLVQSWAHSPIGPSTSIRNTQLVSKRLLVAAVISAIVDGGVPVVTSRDTTPLVSSVTATH